MGIEWQRGRQCAIYSMEMATLRPTELTHSVRKSILFCSNPAFLQIFCEFGVESERRSEDIATEVMDEPCRVPIRKSTVSLYI